MCSFRVGGCGNDAENEMKPLAPRRAGTNGAAARPKVVRWVPVIADDTLVEKALSVDHIKAIMPWLDEAAGALGLSVEARSTPLKHDRGFWINLNRRRYAVPLPGFRRTRVMSEVKDIRTIKASPASLDLHLPCRRDRRGDMLPVVPTQLTAVATLKDRNRSPSATSTHAHFETQNGPTKQAGYRFHAAGASVLTIMSRR